MDVEDATLDPRWDQERLGWLVEPLEKHGAAISRDVIQEICAKLAQCKCVQDLAINLYQKKVIGDKDFQQLQQPTATGSDLSAALVRASQEGELGRGGRLIRDLYLALLDMFAVNSDQSWCHRMALRTLRETAIKHLETRVQLPSDEIDKQCIVANFPDATLESPRAGQLRNMLGMPSSGAEITSLKHILEMYVDTVSEGTSPDEWLVKLVRAMMLTEGVGRYVSKLLPFHQSYPVELLIFLEMLGQHWEKFAFFLGFTVEEVDEIQSSESCIGCFQRVWRMPDLKRHNNDEILHLTLKKADIRLGKSVSRESVTPLQGVNVHFQVNGETVSAHLSPIAQRGSLKKVVDRRHDFSEQKSNSSGYGSTDGPLVPYSSQQTTVDNDDTASLVSLPQIRDDSNISEEDDSSSPIAAQTPSEKSSSSCISSSQRPGTLLLARAKYSRTESLSSPQGPEPPSFLPDDEVTFSVTSSENLGMGLYGEVLVVEHNSRKYAAKEYSRRFIDPMDLKKKFTDRILRLRHANVVPLLGVLCIRGTDRWVVVMEKYSQSLEAVCEDERVEMDPRRKLSILGQVAEGLAYLHDNDVTHGDLIPSNVLLTEPDYMARISDYGNSLVRPISTTCTEGRQDRTYLCDYLPPEAYEGEITDKVDVFAFGHLSLYVVLRRKPHPLKNPIYKLNRKPVARTEVERREDYFDKMRTQAIGVLKPLFEWTKMCLADEANERPLIRKFNSYCSTT